MEAQKIKGSNHSFGEPTDWDEELNGKCNTLAVRAVELVLVEGTPVIESAWRPTEDEMAMLNADGVIILRIYGNGMPPVALYVEASE